jgi:hypothetical protein
MLVGCQLDQMVDRKSSGTSGSRHKRAIKMYTKSGPYATRNLVSAATTSKDATYIHESHDIYTTPLVLVNQNMS